MIIVIDLLSDMDAMSWWKYTGGSESVAGERRLAAS